MPKSPNKLNYVFLLLLVLGILAFFLPWAPIPFLGKFSGLKMVTFGIDKGLYKAAFVSLFPLAYIFLLLRHIGILSFKQHIMTKVIQYLPITMIIGGILYIVFSEKLGALGLLANIYFMVSISTWFISELCSWRKSWK